MSMLCVGRARKPFEVYHAIIGADFIAMIHVVVQGRWFVQESFCDQPMGELGDLSAICDEADMEIAVMDGRATEVNTSGFVAESPEGRDFVAWKPWDGEPRFGKFSRLGTCKLNEFELHMELG